MDTGKDAPQYPASTYPPWTRAPVEHGKPMKANEYYHEIRPILLVLSRE